MAKGKKEKRGGSLARAKAFAQERMQDVHWRTSNWGAAGLATRADEWLLPVVPPPPKSRARRQVKALARTSGASKSWVFATTIFASLAGKHVCRRSTITAFRLSH
ncbi:hypothetical protein M441DRAFT_260653 [Trichoderma asperellum CBS 433.97]|uniref:Uncharacterized protein n=1 Tax=Trichoderma asperellum (strain ATCC 204424 / CBS 433.97 / NBRC 101777) TaxID=1042311 RepID=A0A2T3YZE5_TRIA4|nr:hypothetical protein M441DRAFT_260653 [Trichoderma asperellum CBS 433.97]PTB37915.1 hypothetical protein M441DRAFT_260653 [Trichoderma asperellum CBS 433.97]